MILQPADWISKVPTSLLHIHYLINDVKLCVQFVISRLHACSLFSVLLYTADVPIFVDQGYVFVLQDS
jgi:hypothetical protein